MIGRNIFALACLSAFASASKHFWSPYTWMREKEDQKLSVSIKEFFQVLKDEKDAADGEEEYALIKPLDGNRVRMLDDTLLSDYIIVDQWIWEPV